MNICNVMTMVQGVKRHVTHVEKLLKEENQKICL